MHLMIRLSYVCLFLNLAFACGPRNAEKSDFKGVIGYSQEEAQSDFNTAVNIYRQFYGPLEYKKNVIDPNFNFEDKVTQLSTELRNISLPQAQIEQMLRGEQAASAKTDILARNNKIEGIFKELTAAFADGHVGYSMPKHSGQLMNKSLPIAILPFKANDQGKEEWQAVVVNVEADFAGSDIENGDIILEVDDKAPMAYLEIVKKYENAGSATSLKLLSHVFLREAYMTDLLAITGKEAKIKWQKGPHSATPDVVKTEQFPWRQQFAETFTESYVQKVPRGVGYRQENPALEAALGKESGFKMGQETPFFFTKQLETLLNDSKFLARDLRFIPAESVLKKFALTADTFEPFFAYRYRYADKNILLIRQPTYFPTAMAEAFFNGNTEEIEELSENFVASFKAILFMNLDADVLIIDQTYNPGGVTKYAVDFFRTFLTKEANSIVQFYNADQKNYIELRAEISAEKDPAIKELKKQALAEFETARATGQRLTATIPLGSERKTVIPYDDMRGSDKNFYWRKPIMMLTNAQSGSCGDIVPHLMAQNGVAKIFGERTGGWGGNVETFELPLSLAKTRVTRGLFVSFNGSTNFADYNKDLLIENHGQSVSVAKDAAGNVVQPNPFDRPLRVKDFHDGFVEYFKDFSQVAANL